MIEPSGLVLIAILANSSLRYAWPFERISTSPPEVFKLPAETSVLELPMAASHRPANQTT